MLRNPKEVKNNIVKWIKNYFEENANDASAVIGISGGKDSLVVAALCLEALGEDRVYGVLMPNGIQSDLNDSLEIVHHLKIKYGIVNINDSYSAVVSSIKPLFDNLSAQTLINLPARLRMTTLYAIASSLPNGALVANTCNASEDYVGYSTKFGDSAGDFSPLHDLLVSEVRQIGYELDIPNVFVDKMPSDGLSGKSDEDNLGFKYIDLEEYILNGTSGSNEIDARISQKHLANLHKLNAMPHFNLKER